MRYLDGLFARIGMARFVARLIRTLRQAGETDELHFDAANNHILPIREGEDVDMINEFVM